MLSHTRDVRAVVSWKQDLEANVSIARLDHSIKIIFMVSGIVVALRTLRTLSLNHYGPLHIGCQNIDQAACRWSVSIYALFAMLLFGAFTIDYRMELILSFPFVAWMIRIYF